MANKQVPVQLYNPEKSCVYTVYLNEVDAGRCETDKFQNFEFAQQLLGHAESLENTEENEIALETEQTLKKNVNIPNDTDKASEAEESEEKSLAWSYNETVALITTYEDHKENFKIAKKCKFVWQDISNQLLSNGFERSAVKCESKWRNLIRTYKNVKDMRKSTGRGAVKFKFFDLLDDIVGDKPAMDCPHTFTTLVTTSKKENETKDDILSTETEKHKDDFSHTDSNNSNSALEVKCPSLINETTKKRKRTDEKLKKKSEELIDIKINYFKKNKRKRMLKMKEGREKLKLKKKCWSWSKKDSNYWKSIWKRKTKIKKILNILLFCDDI